MIKYKQVKYLSVSQVADYIMVSAATIRNWVKAKHLTPVSMYPLLFSEKSVIDLKNRIGTMSFMKLKIRANKSYSVSTFLPAEHIKDQETIQYITDVTRIFKNSKLSVEATVFSVAMRFLESASEISKSSGNIFSMDSDLLWRRTVLKTVMSEWHSLLTGDLSDPAYHSIYEICTPCKADDLLGLIYQSLRKEGDKTVRGSYYTPADLIHNSLLGIDTPVDTFLDPCCGSGNYLLSAAKIFHLDLENIFGLDTDKIAVFIAKINILLYYTDENAYPNIYCFDTLSGSSLNPVGHILGKIDVIATNPPWGAHVESANKQNTIDIRSKETFSRFLMKSIQMLRHGGQLSFILPESIMNIGSHAAIREYILNNTAIHSISLLGRQFTGVFTSSIRLHLSKGSAPSDWQVAIKQTNQTFYIPQIRFLNNSYFAFDVHTTQHDKDVVDRLYSIDHVTLDKHAEWAIGIITGDNKRHVFDKQLEDTEPVFRGRDVFQYKLGAPGFFIRFQPHLFQQTAPEKIFRVPEKLIYRFISDRLIFSYDNKQSLTLNSANILIPHIPNMSIWTVLTFLNSKVFQYLFKKLFNTHKVLRGDLERLPFPKLNSHLHQIIEKHSQQSISGEVSQELDNLVFEAFHLTQNEIARIIISI